MKDAPKQAGKVFNAFAERYAEKYMDQSHYRVSLDLFLEKLSSADARILDIATGPANIPMYFLNQNPTLKITGIDLAPNMIEIAKRNIPSGNFLVMDCRDILSLDTTFDGVCCGFCIPYLEPDNVKQLFSDVYKLLNPGAYFLVSGIEDQEKDMEIVQSKEKGAPELISYYYSSESLGRMLEESGFKLIHTQKVHVPEQSLAGQNDVLLLACK
jgi:ubiquinone/menaquinone biosynthesis C-methylase UbiE